MADDVNESLIVPDRGEVLRNRGFRVRVHVLDTEDGTDPMRPRMKRREKPGSEDGEFEYEWTWFKFNMAMLAESDQEPPQGFGGILNVAELMEKQMFMTLAKLFAMFEGYYITQPDGIMVPDWKSGALRMIDTELMTYMSVIMGCLQLAQGGRPEVIGGQVKAAVKKLQDQIDKEVEEGLPGITRIVPDSDSPSSSGTPDGASSTSTPNSSGD